MAVVERVSHYVGVMYLGRLVEIGTGVMLMAVGIMLMFNLMGRLTIFLYQYLPVQG